MSIEKPEEYPENIKFILDANEEIWKYIEVKVYEKVDEYFKKFGMEQKDIWLWTVGGMDYNIKIKLLVNEVCRDAIIEENVKRNRDKK
jgi:tRNA(Leu) C34 or U34 (ribose-2'-O)-methylase TrmL